MPDRSKVQVLAFYLRVASLAAILVPDVVTFVAFQVRPCPKPACARARPTHPGQPRPPPLPDRTLPRPPLPPCPRVRHVSPLTLQASRPFSVSQATVTDVTCPACAIACETLRMLRADAAGWGGSSGKPPNSCARRRVSPGRARGCPVSTSEFSPLSSPCTSSSSSAPSPLTRRPQKT